MSCRQVFICGKSATEDLNDEISTCRSELYNNLRSNSIIYDHLRHILPKCELLESWTVTQHTACLVRFNALSTAQTGNYTELHFCNVSKQRMFILMWFLVNFSKFFCEKQPTLVNSSHTGHILYTLIWIWNVLFQEICVGIISIGDLKLKHYSTGWGTDAFV